MKVRGPVAPGVAGLSGFGPSSRTMLSTESASFSTALEAIAAGAAAGLAALVRGRAASGAAAEPGRCEAGGKKGLGEEKALLEAPVAPSARAICRHRGVLKSSFLVK